MSKWVQRCQRYKIWLLSHTPLKALFATEGVGKFTKGPKATPESAYHGQPYARVDIILKSGT